MRNILIAWILVAIAAGCRSSQKNKSSIQVSIDTAAVSKSKSGQVVKSDSAGKSAKQQATKTETNTATGDKVTAKFGKDSSGSKQPVKITFHPDGSATVDPGGRPLEGVEYEKQKQEQKKDSTGKTTKQTAREEKYDSSHKAKSDSSGVKRVIITGNKSVSRSWPWYWWAIGAAALLVVILFIRKTVQNVTK